MCDHLISCHKQGATEGADAVLSEGRSAGEAANQALEGIPARYYMAHK